MLQANWTSKTRHSPEPQPAASVDIEALFAAWMQTTNREKQRFMSRLPLPVARQLVDVIIQRIPFGETDMRRARRTA